ncbi:hypothetical protein [Microlunatus parietis]|uniref:Uncharacterized protein n=1 Tax=Microlunatus parietis TaxID=682979 RepID=A0A7Y9I904_9ACTN|nr:hypothetical protein [Microlunatus parietis]NYE72310.1 hypothetical protein [Microlunatus parietis]
MIELPRTPADRAAWLLRIAPLLWLMMLINDAGMVTLVALFGEPLAFPGQDRHDAPYDIPMVPISPEPLLVVAAFAAVCSAAELLIASRLPAGRGPALVLLGVATAPYALLVAAAVAFNPLTVITFGGGDAGMPEVAPGPFWYQPTRGMLLVVITLLRIGAVIIAGLRDPDRTTDVVPTRRRPFGVLLAALALPALIGVAGLIMISNGLAVVDQVNRATALGPEPFALKTFWWRTVSRMLILIALLAVVGAASVITLRLVHAVTARPARAIAAGFTAAAWLPVLYFCLLINPGGWRAPLRLGAQRMEVAWYPPVLTVIMIVAVVALVALAIALIWPGTAHWLATGTSPDPRHVPAADHDGVDRDGGAADRQ